MSEADMGMSPVDEWCGRCGQTIRTDEPTKPDQGGLVHVECRHDTGPPWPYHWVKETTFGWQVFVRSPNGPHAPGELPPYSSEDAAVAYISGHQDGWFDGVGAGVMHAYQPDDEDALAMFWRERHDVQAADKRTILDLIHEAQCSETHSPLCQAAYDVAAGLSERSAQSGLRAASYPPATST